MTDRVAMPLALLELLEGPLAIRVAALRPFLAWVQEGSIPVTALMPERPQTARTQGGTKVLAVRGPITRRHTALSFLCGGASCEEMSAQLHEALVDPAVSRIVLDIDSPGGEVAGIPELAREIYDARTKKPITALVDTMAASAAYWLASQATDVVVAPSGQVGSIGVIAVHLDRSRELEAAGVTPTFITAGKYKAEGNALQPLGDEAREEIQRKVDAAYSMFVGDVARGRGLPVETVRSSFGEGRMVLAKDAVAKGMADKVSTRAPSSIRAEQDALHLAAAASRAAVALADIG